MSEQRRGVYLFKEDSPREVEVNKVHACDVWHQRLGHPSKADMSLFSSKVGIFNKCS